MREIGTVGEYVLIEDGFWVGTKNKDGRICVSPDLHYRDILDFKDGIAIAVQEVKGYREFKWGLIDECGDHVSDFKYDYVTVWGEGYYRCDIGARNNILRREGTEVLSEWFNSIHKVVKEYFTFSNTIRKSKKNGSVTNCMGNIHENYHKLLTLQYEK